MPSRISSTPTGPTNIGGFAIPVPANISTYQWRIVAYRMTSAFVGTWGQVGRTKSSNSVGRPIDLGLLIELTYPLACALVARWRAPPPTPSLAKLSPGMQLPTGCTSVRTGLPAPSFIYPRGKFDARSLCPILHTSRALPDVVHHWCYRPSRGWLEHRRFALCPHWHHGRDGVGQGRACDGPTGECDAMAGRAHPCVNNSSLPFSYAIFVHAYASSRPSSPTGRPFRDSTASALTQSRTSCG